MSHGRSLPLKKRFRKEEILCLRSGTFSIEAKERFLLHDPLFEGAAAHIPLLDVSAVSDNFPNIKKMSGALFATNKLHHGCPLKMHIRKLKFSNLILIQILADLIVRKSAMSVYILK